MSPGFGILRALTAWRLPSEEPSTFINAQQIEDIDEMFSSENFLVVPTCLVEFKARVIIAIVTAHHDFSPKLAKQRVYAWLLREFRSASISQNRSPGAAMDIFRLIVQIASLCHYSTGCILIRTWKSKTL